MIDHPVNAFKSALAAGRPQIGLWCSLAGAVPAEICAGAGFDWLLFDGEHTPNDVRSTLAQLQAVQAYPVTAMVRPPIGDPVLIKQYLDIGALNLLIPMIDTADQARRMAAACLYPPHGFRGVASQTRAGRWGRVKDYLPNAREGIGLFVQIETTMGLSNLEEIARVDGVDGVFVGPSDLAAALGHLGRPGEPEVQAAVVNALKGIQAAGKPAGILIADEALAHQYLDLGATFVAVGLDTLILAQGTTALRQRFDRSPAEGSGAKV